jgi:futalosine hydrolase
MIVIAAATPFETAWITTQLIKLRSVSLGKFRAFRGRLGTAPALIYNTGVGKTNAAHGTTLLLERFKPSLFLLIGCGGAYTKSGMLPGDLAIATEEIFGDEGVIMQRGWRSMQYLKLPLLRKGDEIFYNLFPMDQGIVNRAKKILQSFRPKTGRFVTVSEVTGTQKKADEMERRFRGICENMEGAAVAQLCTLYGIPMLEIRGISNLVKQRDKRGWNLPAAVSISQQAAIEVVMHWGKMP